MHAIDMNDGHAIKKYLSNCPGKYWLFVIVMILQEEEAVLFLSFFKPNKK